MSTAGKQSAFSTCDPVWLSSCRWWFSCSSGRCLWRTRTATSSESPLPTASPSRFSLPASVESGSCWCFWFFLLVSAQVNGEAATLRPSFFAHARWLQCNCNNVQNDDHFQPVSASCGIASIKNARLFHAGLVFGLENTHKKHKEWVFVFLSVVVEATSILPWPSGLHWVALSNHCSPSSTWFLNCWEEF